MTKITRREFLKKTAKGTVATVSGVAAIDKLLSPEQAQASTAAKTGNNAKNAGSVISLPKGGGAIQGIGETFKPNPFTGTANFSVPIATSPGRSGFGPELGLQYSSGSGNSPFGLGWQLSVPMVSRKTDRGIPKYTEDDTFILSGSEDLVRKDSRSAGNYQITTYRPRTEGLFARIERWERISGAADSSLNDTFWKITTRDNVSSIYGLTKKASLSNPDQDLNPAQNVFQWLLELTFDDKGNYIRYVYKSDLAKDLQSRPSEQHRVSNEIAYQTYLKSIHYGNHTPFLPNSMIDVINHMKADLDLNNYFFLAIFDYGEHGNKTQCTNCPDGQFDQIIHENMHEEKDSNNILQNWDIRPDAFSYYRSGFEIRTYRRCQRVLMFHYMPDENNPTLVKSTDFHYEQLPYSEYSCLKSVTQRGYRKLVTVRSDSEAILSEEIEMRAINLPAAANLTGAKSRYYWIKSIPPLTFSYSQFEPQKQRFQPFSAEGGDMPPVSLRDPNTTLIDITRTGLPDILQTSPAGYFYWQNLGEGKFDRRRQLKNQPAGVTLDQPGVGFGDMAGDGYPDLLVHSGPKWGFYEADSKGGWQQARFYKRFPSFSLADPNIRLTDLTGDGKADILRTDDRSFTWFPCLGEEGFDEPHYVRRVYDLEEFPDVFFNDPRVQMADMSGDGLNDIVFIHSGRIDYWPNLGYGKFGKRITMENTPRFGYNFDPQRLFLLDIDGSGPVDMVYVESGKVRFWFNQSGNGWSEGSVIEGTPYVTDADSLQLADMFGSGSTGILWSSDYRANGRPHYMHLDFTGGRKPNVLIEIDNNLGKITRAEYKPSTYFYLKDRGKDPYEPWLTTLPFVTQCLERVEVIDRISKTKLVTSYAYHHGYYDGNEREFRGFAFVEQRDTESFRELSKKTSPDDPDFLNISSTYHAPPVYTKTWFHTGAFPADLDVDLRVARRDRNAPLNIRDIFARDYYQGDRDAPTLPPSVLLRDDQPIYELHTLREAYRALRGQVLRQEVYADDISDRAEHPYTVSTSNAAVKLLQARGENAHAVLFVHPRESLSFQYERKIYRHNGKNIADPRTSHNVTLKVDEYGNVLESLSVAYGRRIADATLSEADQARQQATALIYNKNDYTNAILEDFAYRTKVPCENKSYQLHNINLNTTATGPRRIFNFAELAQQVANATDGNHYLPYEDFKGEQLVDNQAHSRLIEHQQIYYRRNHFNKLDILESAESTHAAECRLPLGAIESKALPYETRQLAFTNDLLADIYDNRINEEVMLASDGKYHRVSGENGGVQWWVRSGISYFSPNSDDSCRAEMDFAESHFYLPYRMEDPFGNVSFVTYDDLLLLPETATDPLNNSISAENDYRVLQPIKVTDPNGNRSAVSFDALGMVVGTAIMGKKNQNVGDTLDGFEADLNTTTIHAFLRDPLALQAESQSNPYRLLQKATTRLIYDLYRYIREGEPLLVYTMARETHHADLTNGQKTKIQHSISYSDGFGRELQKKIQAEPGKVSKRDASGNIIVDENNQPEETEAAVNPRWVCSGWTVFNNKGKPVRQFEPFFSEFHRFEFNVRLGVSPILFYDPIQRGVATLHPNHTYEKVIFDPWRQESWDVNDTVLLKPEEDSDIRQYLFDENNAPLLTEEYSPTWYELRTDPEKAEKRWRNRRIRNAEREAAEKAAVHAATPVEVFLDALGRTFLSRAHNGFDENGLPIKYTTRTIMDIAGNPREVIDALARVVMRYKYDLLGNRTYQISMEAGERWMLNDVSGNPIHAWDSRGHHFHSEYDALRRPIHAFVTGAVENDPNKTILVERQVYGEQHPQALDKNLRGTLCLHFDQSGMVRNDRMDFKGNPRRVSRRIGKKYKEATDWRALKDYFGADGTITFTVTGLNSKLAELDLLESETFRTQTSYDALNRPKRLTTPHTENMKPSRIRLSYNDANLLEKIDVNLREAVVDNGPKIWTAFVTNIDYNSKGQRERIRYGNDVVTKYTYDRTTFRLSHLATKRGRTRLQDIKYTYDPVGNITYIRDNAEPRNCYRGVRVEPDNAYVYDAIYRLIEATGREHVGQVQRAQPPGADNSFHTNTNHAADGQAMDRYCEKYCYDAVGNILAIKHRAICDASENIWTRNFTYNEPSLIDAGTYSNRLSNCTVGNDNAACTVVNDNPTPGPYSHDAHGNMTAMPHLSLMKWDYRDQLQASARQVITNGTPVTTYYVYDAGGQRIRKVTESQASAGNAPLKVKETIYLGGFEIYREYDPADAQPNLERETLHIIDGQQRIALVENRTMGSGSELAELVRYQLNNHLGSSCIEVNESGRVISCEEYFPYGSTSFQKVLGQIEVPKRYRYTGKERDEESGFYYHGARYYAAWLGRWINTDPIGIKGGENLFRYSRNNPIVYLDPNGTKETEHSSSNLKQKSVDHPRIRFSGEILNSELKTEDTENSMHTDTTNTAVGSPHSTSDESNDNLMNFLRLVDYSIEFKGGFDDTNDLYEFLLEEPTKLAVNALTIAKEELQKGKEKILSHKKLKKYLKRLRKPGQQNTANLRRSIRRILQRINSDTRSRITKRLKNLFSGSLPSFRQIHQGLFEEIKKKDRWKTGIGTFLTVYSMFETIDRDAVLYNFGTQDERITTGSYIFRSAITVAGGALDTWGKIPLTSTILRGALLDGFPTVSRIMDKIGLQEMSDLARTGWDPFEDAHKDKRLEENPEELRELSLFPFMHN